MGDIETERCRLIHEFTANIPQAALDDLRTRVKNTRWPDEMLHSQWTYGASLSYMKELADYWANGFDWRMTEDRINGYPNFIAEINGFKIHYLHIRGNGKIRFPLIITHGWPGSFLEMMEIIPLLTEPPEFSFDLVIPSMIGYGFSQKADQPGCNVFLMADLWCKLMETLGYERFGAQGGDFGAGVSSALALRYPEHLAGIHLNYIPGNYSPVLAEGEKFSAGELQFLDEEEKWFASEGAYALQQKTKPLTLAYGLNDSPVGLCAWMVEKYYAWAECHHNIETVFAKDELLSQVTLYWLTETIHSSIRLYNENSKAPMKVSNENFIAIPVGIAHFPFEAPFPPKAYVQRGFNIQHWTDMPSGGHFPAMEVPELLSTDILQFFRSLVQGNKV